MLKIDIPGYKTFRFRFLVSDYNGTLACDGKLIPEARPFIQSLAENLEIHIVTADTFGFAKGNVQGLPVRLVILEPNNQDRQKANYVRNLDSESAIALGNGRNDALMLKEAALGISIVGDEGGCVESMMAADVVCRSVIDALGLLVNTRRLIATLRS